MPPRSGVYSKVLKLYPFSDARFRGDTQVAVLECGHGTLVKKQAQAGGETQYPKRTHCVLCTRKAVEEEKARPKPRRRLAQVEAPPASTLKRMVETLVRSAVESALADLTAPKAPVLSVVEPKSEGGES